MRRGGISRARVDVADALNILFIWFEPPGNDPSYAREGGRPDKRFGQNGQSGPGHAIEQLRGIGRVS